MNERGCDLFHKSLKAFENRRDHITDERDGVLEKYRQEEKTYATSTVECDCTFFGNNQAPCRHIIFKREHDGLPIFDVTLFHIRYHKKTSNFSEANIQDADTLLAEFPQEHTAEDSDYDGKILSVREKYNKILPIALSIASIASNHGATQFDNYLSSLKIVEKLVRDGKNIQCLPIEVPASSQAASTTSSPVNDSTQSCSTNQGITTSSLPEEDSSRFQNLKFKSKVRCRGRPKLPARQLCSFNKSVADREAVEKTSKTCKRKRTVSSQPSQPAKGPTTRKRAKESS